MNRIKTLLPLLLLMLFASYSYSQNLITNPGFESNTTGWSLATYNSASGSLSRVTSQSHSGTASGQINITASGAAWEVQFIAAGSNIISLESGKTYELKLWAKSNSSRTDALQLRVAQPSPYQTIGGTTTVSTTSSWTEYVHTFTADANYSQARITILCGSFVETYYFDDIILQEVAVPTANFTSNITSLTEGGSVNFTDTSTDNPTSWSWTFEGGSPASSTAQNPTVSYATAGTYDVTLVATNAAGADTTRVVDYITVNVPPPVASFTADTTSVTEGGSVSFTDNSSNSPTSWSWSFSGGTPATSTAQNPVVAYNTQGTYDVTLTATNASGSDTEIKTAFITVNASPQVVSNLLDNTGFETNTDNWELATYVSVSGSLTRSTSQFHNGVASGQVSVTATDGTSWHGQLHATGSNLVSLENGKTYVLKFWARSNTSRANSLIISVAQPSPYLAIGGSTTVSTTPTWTEYVHTFTADANYPVARITITCSKFVETYHFDDFVLGELISPPVANFSASTTSLSEGNNVIFTDNTTNNPTSWSWSFEGGTPATSNAQNPVVTYNTDGVYDVTLTATNDVGSDVEIKTNYIVVNTGVIQSAVNAAQSGEVIIINGGTYRESVTIPNDKSITIKAAPGEKVVIDGREELSGLSWSQGANNIWSAVIPPALQQAFVSNEAMVFSDDYPYVEARYPNMKFHENWEENKKWATLSSSSTYGVAVSNDVAGLNISLAGGYLHLKYVENFFGSSLITSHTAGSSNINYEQTAAKWGDWSNTGFKGGKGNWDYRFYVTGVLELLDVEEEWFFDEGTNILHIKTPGNVNPSTLNLSVKVRDLGIYSESADDVTIEGIDLFATSMKMGVFKQDNCKNLVIKGCKILYPNHNRIVEVLDNPSTSSLDDRIYLISENWIFIDGNNALIENCEIGWAENRGIYLNGKANVLKNCVIHNTALNGIMHYSGVELGFGYGQIYDVSGPNKLENSTIYNCGGVAVYHRGPGPEEINYNHLFNSGIYSGDISAYYLPYAKKSQGSVVSYNWVHNTLGKALRVDSWGDSIYIHHNVVWNNSEGTKWQGPGPWYIYNNTIFDEVSSLPITIWVQEFDYDSQLCIDEYGVDFVPTVSYYDRFLNNSNVMNNLSYQLYYRGSFGIPDYIYSFHENSHFTKNDEIGGQESQFFVSPNLSTIDLRPKLGSPAINAGVAITGFTDYVTDGSPDLGAYEYGGTYWYPGASWMNDGMFVPTTMADANQLAASLLSNPTQKSASINSDIIYDDQPGLQQDFNLYPNPVQNHVTVLFPGESQVSSLDVYNVQGVKVLSKEGLSGLKQLTLDLSGLTGGVYIVRTYSNTGDVININKLIKE